MSGSNTKKTKGKKLNGMALRYHLDDQTEKGKQLRHILEEMCVKVRDVSEEELLETVGFLAGTVGFESSKETFQGEAPACELLLLKGFPDPRLTELFTRLRKAQMEKIELKAVVTETNREWTMMKLIEEIGKEHQAMTDKNVASKEGRESADEETDSQASL